MNAFRALLLAFAFGIGFQLIHNAHSDDTLYWTQQGAWSPPHFGVQTANIAGGLLLAGACNATTVTVTGATTSMVAVASPVTDPGAGMDWRAFVSAPDTVTVRMCAIVGFTATSTAFNVKVLR